MSFGHQHISAAATFVHDVCARRFASRSRIREILINIVKTGNLVWKVDFADFRCFFGQGTTCTLPGSEHFCDFPQRDTPCGGFYYLPFKEKVTQVGGVDPLSGFLDSRNPQRFDESGQGSVSLSSAGTAFCDFPQRDTPCGGFLLRFFYGFAEFLWVVGARL